MGYITRVRLEYSDGDEVGLGFDDGRTEEGFVDFREASPDTVWGRSSMKLFAKLLRLIEDDNLNNGDF